MIQDSDGFMRPVYCDMESNLNEGWTLLVSAATSGWGPSQVRMVCDLLFLRIAV